eukprot:TRINITY_DN27471_c0_g1_i1.p1 TRINITY_DN27471_c0_g1~~TRINITY_DN27471_c0_g1_i1.p1  ORF type:complete len:347 (+),score=80.03 TRINITY_DN27471_c0_g1_i1:107-1147(+)
MKPAAAHCTDETCTFQLSHSSSKEEIPEGSDVQTKSQHQTSSSHSGARQRYHKGAASAQAKPIEEPLEYVAMDALRDLSPETATRLMRSLRLSALRTERTEQLVLELQSQLKAVASQHSKEAKEGKNEEETCEEPLDREKASQRAADTAHRRVLVPAPFLVLLVVLSATVVLVTAYWAGLERLAETPGREESSSCPVAAIESKDIADGAGDEESNVKLLVAEAAATRRVHEQELVRLGGRKKECERTAKDLRAQITALRQNHSKSCSVANVQRAEAVVTQEAGQDEARVRNQQASMDALSLVNSMKARFARLQTEKVALLRERDGCHSCIRKAGGFGQCAGIEAQR